MLPGTNLDDASKAAVRACEAIEKCPFRHDEKELRVTVSFGVAEVLGNEDGAMLVARADKALYAAKEGGRNCVYRHDGETVASGCRQQGACRFQSPKANRRADPRHANRKKTGKLARRRMPMPRNRSLDLPHAVELNAVSGLPCRTTFCQQVRNRTAEWKRGGPTFSVVLIEVNQYEQGGTHRGQQAREAATRAATRFLAATVREMDTVGHYAPGCFAPAVAHGRTCRRDPGGRAASGRVLPVQPLGARRATEAHAERRGGASHGKGRFHLAAQTSRSSPGCRRSPRRQSGLLPRW